MTKQERYGRWSDIPTNRTWQPRGLARAIAHRVPGLILLYFSNSHAHQIAFLGFEMSYSRVDEEDGTSSDSEGFSERKHFLGDGKLDVSRPISGQGKVWIVSTFILLFLLGLVGSFELWIRVLSRRESYEAGFQTELGGCPFLRLEIFSYSEQDQHEISSRRSESLLLET